MRAAKASRRASSVASPAPPPCALIDSLPVSIGQCQSYRRPRTAPGGRGGPERSVFEDARRGSRAALPCKSMETRDDRIRALEALLADRILVMGGPYGTYIH